MSRQMSAVTAPTRQLPLPTTSRQRLTGAGGSGWIAPPPARSCCKGMR